MSVVSRASLFVVVLVAGAACLPSAAWSQTTRYVDDDAPNDPGPGDTSISDPLEDGSAEHPFDAIQEAIDASSDGDEVLVRPGSYTGLGNYNMRYNGKAITIRSENGPETCAIDCEDIGWRRAFWFNADETNDSVLEGFTIRNCRQATIGSAIYCTTGSPVIRSCVITGCSDDTGTIYCGGTTQIIDTRIISNHTVGIVLASGTPVVSGVYIDDVSGAGIKINAGTAEVRDSTIKRAWNVSPLGHGTGIAAGSGATVVVERCTLQANESDGVFAYNESVLRDLEVSNCGTGIFASGQTRVERCTAQANGTGIVAYQGAVVVGATVTQSTGTGIDANNSAVVLDAVVTQNGGAGIDAGDTALIARCQIAGNQGTGVRLDDESLLLDSVVSGNSGTQGGGVFLGYAARMINCTVVDNVAEEGGGVWVDADYRLYPYLYRPPEISNSIIWGNGASIGADLAMIDLHWQGSSKLAIDHSIFGTTPGALFVVPGGLLTLGPGNLSVAPWFADQVHGDYSPLFHSPTIDRGDATAYVHAASRHPELLFLDVDGAARLIDDSATPNAGTGVVPFLDIGAHEFYSDCNNNGIEDADDVSSGFSEDCNANGVPDECESDCNQNGVVDACDLTEGTSVDCDGTLYPDECETDCNNNGVADTCDLGTGLSLDCNANGVPDECEAECNGNGVPDDCDIATGAASDCNFNGHPDECDLSDALSEDCNHNQIPDECDAGRFEICSLTLRPGLPTEFPLLNPPAAESDVEVTLTGIGIAGGTPLSLNGEVVSNPFACDGSTDCTDAARTTTVRVPRDLYNEKIRNGEAVWSAGVAACLGRGFVRICVAYDRVDTTVDANGNGALDVCETGGEPILDCNGNGIHDYWDIWGEQHLGTGTIYQARSGQSQVIEFSDVPLAAGGTEVRVEFNYTLSQAAIPHAYVRMDTNLIAQLANDTTCSESDVRYQEAYVDAETFNGYVKQDGHLDVSLFAEDVDVRYFTFDAYYKPATGSLDCNGDSTPDECELGPRSPADCNRDGRIDACQLDVPRVLFFDGFENRFVDAATWPLVDGAATSSALAFKLPRSLDLDETDRVESRSLDLRGLSDVSVEYYWFNAGADAGESLDVQFWDGAVWRLLGQEEGGTVSTEWALRTITLPPEAYHGDFKLSFQAQTNSLGDDWYLDEVGVYSPADANHNGQLDVCDERGDVDANGIVDWADAAWWGTCMLGPNAGQAMASCERLDFDFDARIDLFDEADFMNAFTGVP